MAVALFDKDGKCAYVNKSFSKAFGIKDNCSLKDLFSADALREVLKGDRLEVECVFDPGKKAGHDYSKAGKSGACCKFLLNALISGKGNKPEGYIMQVTAVSGSRVRDEEFEMIVEGSTIPAFVLRKDHRIGHWNKAMEALTGLSKDEMVGTCNQWRLFYPSKRPILADLVIDRASETEIAKLYKNKYKQSGLISGAYEGFDFFPLFGVSGKWIHFSASPIRDASGGIVGAIETAQDITERITAQQGLAKSEERYRSLVECSYQSISNVNRDGVFLFMNKASASMLGGKPSDYVGNTMWDIFPKPIANRQMASVRSVIDSGKARRIDNESIVLGGTRWFETDIQPLIDVSGQCDSALVIANDITDRILSAKQIQSLKEFSENIVESAPIGILVVDMDKKINACNKANEEIFALPRHQALGKVIYRDYLEGLSDAINPLLDKALSEGRVSQRKGIEYSVSGYGKSLTLDIFVSPLYTGGEITGAVVITKDVTERRLLKERVRILEKKELPLTEKDKLVLYGLVRHPEYNDIELSKKLRIKRSTLTSIKNKLSRGGFYSTMRIPNLPVLGYELVSVSYGTFVMPRDRDEKGFFEKEMECPEYVSVVSTGLEYYTIFISRNITEYKEKTDPLETEYDRRHLVKYSSSIHFPFDLSLVRNVSDYCVPLHNWFRLGSEDSDPHLIWNVKAERKLTENEGKVLYALTKYPTLSDKDVSEKIGLNKITVGQIKKRLMDESYVRTARIPDLKKIGCELMLLIHIRFNPHLSREERAELIDKELREAVTCIADAREAVCIIPFKDFTEYKRVFDAFIQNNKNKLFLDDPKTLLIPVNMIKMRKLDFAPLLKKALDIKEDY